MPAIVSGFTRIIVIQSLPPVDGNPGRRLADDICARVAAMGSELPVEFREVGSRLSFLEFLSASAQPCRGQKREKPILHFECHGSGAPGGLEMKDGSIVTWEDLKAPLTELNIASECGLFLTLATCYGGWLGEIASLTERAPMLAYVGPRNSLASKHLATGFSHFYDTLLAGGDVDRALQKLNTPSLPPNSYVYISTPLLLVEAYRQLESEMASQQTAWGRARTLRERMRQSGSQRLPSIQDVMLEWKKAKPGTAMRLAEHFLMLDLFPDNRRRFEPALRQLEASVL
jgi:hypothetical protein